MPVIECPRDGCAGSWDTEASDFDPVAVREHIAAEKALEQIAEAQGVDL